MPPMPPPDSRRDDDAFGDVVVQLDEYFAGTRTAFDLPMTLEGTDFQRRVWAELCAIPYGETISYGELARRVGNPKASRAVGLANGRNPVAVIVPCHRVIAADGSLGGYGGGLDRKVPPPGSGATPSRLTGRSGGDRPTVSGVGRTGGRGAGVGPTAWVQAALVVAVSAPILVMVAPRSGGGHDGRSSGPGGSDRVSEHLGQDRLSDVDHLLFG